MQDSMDKCGQCPDKPLTAERIIKELIRAAEPEHFKTGLHDLFVSWVQYNEVNSGEYKDMIIRTYINLNDLLDSVIKLKS